MLRLLAWCAGPMLAKELIELSRRPRWYAMRAALGLGLLLALTIGWNQWDHAGYAYVTIQSLAELGRLFFAGIGTTAFVAIFVAVPPLLCGAIAAEREAGTLDLLFTTQLSGREIVLGKFGSALVVACLLLAAVTPVLYLCGMLGGVDPWDVGLLGGTCLATAVWVAAQSIYASCVCRTPLGALVRTYATLALWIIVIPVTGLVILEAGEADDTIIHTFRVWIALANCLLLFIGLFETIIPDDVYAQTGFPLHPTGFAVLTAWSAGIVALAIWKVRRQQRRCTASAVQATGRSEWRAIARWWTSPWRKLTLGLPNPLVGRAAAAPVYDREGYVGHALALLLILYAVLGGLTADGEYTPGSDREALFVMSTIAAGVLIAIVAAMSFVSDRRRGMLDLLLATPLSGRQLFDGTLLAVWQHVWIGPVVLAALVIGYNGFSFPPPLLALWAATILLESLLWVVAGVACSLPARSPAGVMVPFSMLLVFRVAGNCGVLYYSQSWRAVAVLVAVLTLTVLLWRHRWANTPWWVALNIALIQATAVLLIDPTATRFQTARQLDLGTPITWVLFPLSHVFEQRWYSYESAPDAWSDLLAEPYTPWTGYLIATAVTMVIVRAWVVWRFDELAGRGARHNKPSSARPT